MIALVRADGGDQLEERADERVVFGQGPGGVRVAHIEEALGDGGVGRPSHPGRRPLAPRGQGGLKHRFAVGEMLVEGASGDADGLSYPGDGGPLDAVLADQEDGRLDDLGLPLRLRLSHKLLGVLLAGLLRHPALLLRIGRKPGD
jgi:hypothetical protein